MAKTPDPNYWGNPPQTPQSKYARAAQSNAAYQQQAQPEIAQQPASQQQTQQPVLQQQPVQSQQIPQQPPAPELPVAPQQKKSKRGLIIGIIVAIAVVLGLCAAGITACISIVEEIAEQNTNLSLPENNNDQSINDSTDTTSQLNQDFREAFGLSSSTQAISVADLDLIQTNVFNNASKAADESGQYAPEVYYVGSDLSAGMYWFTGSDTELSEFFILQASESDNGAYDVVHSNTYYGHNLMEFKDGDVVIFINDGTMMPIDKMTSAFTAPYTSGVYRVGTDVPAGTYSLSLGEAYSYSAYYVMTDLEYNDDSYTDSGFYTKSGEGSKVTEITLEEGQYVELYNMTMTPTGQA